MKAYLAACVVALSLAAKAWAGAAEDWLAVTALDRGPGVQARSLEEARGIAAAHLDRQEKVLALTIPDQAQQVTGHREPPLRACTGFSRDIRHAGYTPESKPNSAARIIPYANTRRLMEKWA